VTCTGGTFAGGTVGEGPFAAKTTIVIDGLTTLGRTAGEETPLVALIVKVEEPGEVGVPERTPVIGFKVRPAGSDPDDTLKVGAGFPDATNVYE
jgi:hypothetical protein